MKRRSTQPRSRRARKGRSRSPYAKYNKKPYKYPFPVGKAHAEASPFTTETQRRVRSAGHAD